jgi:hypothetical protein
MEALIPREDERVERSPRMAMVRPTVQLSTE